MKVVAIISGGMDSAVLLWSLRAEGHEVLALGVDYGQRHRKELEHGARLAASLGVPWMVADLRAVLPLLAGSSQTSPEIAVPDGHYEDQSMRITVVPNRNMIMLSVAIGFAISQGARAVAYAAHAGDHAVYPDCRPEFVAALRGAAGLAHYEPIEIIAPFVDREMSKADLVRLGTEIMVPFGETWSCYKGGDVHCGTCGTCTERREAFALAGVPDPTSYA